MSHYPTLVRSLLLSAASFATTALLLYMEAVTSVAA
jgi:hypothetical protein